MQVGQIKNQQRDWGLQDGFYQFGSNGIFIDSISDFDFAVIKKEVDKIRNNLSAAKDANDNLIGQLDTSKYLIDSFDVCEREVLRVAEYHNEYCGHWDKQKMNFATDEGSKYKLKLETLWVNFQKKYEFQPIHDHRGIYSFIIFVQIPFTFDEEKKVAPGAMANDQISGQLCFHYVSSDGRVATMNIPADKNWAKRIIVFPAYQMHSVYPFFSSDDYRITISGNLVPKLPDNV